MKKATHMLWSEILEKNEKHVARENRIERSVRGLLLPEGPEIEEIRVDLSP